MSAIGGNSGHRQKEPPRLLRAEADIGPFRTAQLNRYDAPF